MIILHIKIIQPNPNTDDLVRIGYEPEENNPTEAEIDVATLLSEAFQLVLASTNPNGTFQDDSELDKDGNVIQSIAGES